MRRRLAHNLVMAVSAAALVASPLSLEIAVARESKANKDAADHPEKAWSRWIPQSYANSAEAANSSEAGSQAPQRRWWIEFQNPELDELQAIAAANNADLKVAVARVAQAEARARISNAGQSPTIDALVRAERRAPEFGIGTAPTRGDYRSRKIYQAGLRVGYEVDLWGKGSYQEASALAQIRASTFAREAFGLSLAADVATTYFEVLSLRQRVALAETDLDTARKIGLTINRRVARGDLSLFEQEQQEIAITDAEARVYELQQQQDRAEGDLAYLVGRPRGMLQISGASLDDIAIPVIQPGLPSTMICRRPDVRQAEAELAGARADIGLARKSLMPTFSLTAEGGYGTSNLGKALAPQSIFTDIVGQLVQSIFDGGRRKGEIARNKAMAEEMLERYRSGILRALRDVEEALSGTRLTGERLMALDGSASRAERLVTLSARVFDRGAIDYGSLLESQRLHFRTRQQAVEARYDRLRAAVDLYKALGGGLTYRGDTCESDSAATAPAPAPASAGATTANANAAEANTATPAYAPMQGPSDTAAVSTEQPATDAVPAPTPQPAAPAAAQPVPQPAPVAKKKSRRW